MGDCMNKHGVFSWNELCTNDVEAAKDFYQKLLGWQYDNVPCSDGSDYFVVKVEDKAVAGLMKMPAAVPAGVPPHWGAYITVDDVDAITEKAVELGANVIVQPTDIPNMGRFSIIQDPQGASV